MQQIFSQRAFSQVKRRHQLVGTDISGAKNWQLRCSMPTSGSRQYCATIELSTKGVSMPRWQQGSEERLKTAAIELFAAQGFENTSVAQIAERAGVTNRTFFRYFADKREVLFAESDSLRDGLLEQIRQAPRNAKPFSIITDVLANFDPECLGPRDFQRKRQMIIAANPELRERDLIKINNLTLALVDALEQRGIDNKTAQLAARVGVQLFATAYQIWLEEGGDIKTISKKLKPLLVKIVS